MCDTLINQFNVPAENKQGATEFESEESEFNFYIYAQFVLQLTYSYVCN